MSTAIIPALPKPTKKRKNAKNAQPGISQFWSGREIHYAGGNRDIKRDQQARLGRRADHDTASHSWLPSPGMSSASFVRSGRFACFAPYRIASRMKHDFPLVRRNYDTIGLQQLSSFVAAATNGSEAPTAVIRVTQHRMHVTLPCCSATPACRRASRHADGLTSRRRMNKSTTRGTGKIEH